MLSTVQTQDVIQVVIYSAVVCISELHKIDSQCTVFYGTSASNFLNRAFGKLFSHILE